MNIFKIIILIFITHTNFLFPCQIESLSLRQKIGRLIIAAAVSNEDRNQEFMRTQPYHMEKKHLDELITKYHIGGVIFLGTCHTDELVNIITHYQTLSKNSLLMALDAEWPAMRLKNLDPALQLPHHMTLGALQDNSLVEKAAYINGKILQNLGVHMNFAPVADVNNNDQNPVINDRSFGSDPQRVAQKVIAFAKGLQNAGIVSCAKHFPGHGDTAIDSHYGLPVISHNRDRLDAIELVPFRAAIAAEVPAIMTAHIHLPGLETQPNTPATLSKNIITNLLRKELGFNGLIITDGLGMKGVIDHLEPGELEVRALEAGADILLCPVDVPKAIDAIEKAIYEKRIHQEEIDEKVMRVLKAKKWAFENNSNTQKQNIFSRSSRSSEASRGIRTKNMVNSSIHTNEAQWQELIQESAQLKKLLYQKAITIAQDNSNNNPEIIVQLQNMNKFKNKNFGISDKMLQNLAQLKMESVKRSKVTIVLYGSPYAVELIKDYADRVIVAYEDDPNAHAAVQDIIAGALKAEGTMPV